MEQHAETCDRSVTLWNSGDIASVEPKVSDLATWISRGFRVELRQRLKQFCDRRSKFRFRFYEFLPGLSQRSFSFYNRRVQSTYQIISVRYVSSSASVHSRYSVLGLWLLLICDEMPKESQVASEMFGESLKSSLVQYIRFHRNQGQTPGLDGATEMVLFDSMISDLDTWLISWLQSDPE